MHLLYLQNGAVNLQPDHTKTTFGLTIFLSAFLLFWVQLLLGKYILPWFGGTPAVWTTCMLFFQVLLLGGYIYAHFLSSGRLDARTQGYLHCVFLFGSLLLLTCGALAWNSPLTPGSTWTPHGAGHPVWHIIVLLSISVGFPYFVLSSTGPLLQAWYRGVYGGGSTYRLYALSNLGSFLALLFYPILLEPGLTLKSQAWLWSLMFLVFVLGCAYCAFRRAGSRVPEVQRAAYNAEREVSAPGGAEILPPSRWNYLLWVSLSACASIMFLATTTQICQDVGVVPLLWILPLGLYLLTFVICFEHERSYSRGWFHPLFALAIFGSCFVLSNGATGSLFAQIAIYAFVLLTICMVCNGELVRSKPHSRYLTSFYLTVATGGALGGVFVALVAPNIFRGFWEYQVGLWMSALLLVLILVRDKQSWLYRSRIGSPVVVGAVAVLLPESIAFATGEANTSTSYISAMVALFLIVYMLANRNQTGPSKAREQAAPLFCWATLLVLGGVLSITALAQVRNAVALSRNFYGVIAVRQQDMEDPQRAVYSLTHGRILHGFQLRAQPERRTPTAYYAPASGVGVAILRSASESALGRIHLRIGVVGLGIGTIAAYGHSGDTIRFYEINPEVIRIAGDRKYFTFLSDCPANVEVIPGDARLSMERELERNEHQNFDVLVIDAFSGDSIPIHLLTQEAFGIYLRQLKKPSGILAIHITNTYLDLRPVVFGAAKHFGLKTVWVHSVGDGRAAKDADWMLLSLDNKILGSDVTANVLGEQIPHFRVIRPWTDDYSNLFQILNR